MRSLQTGRTTADPGAAGAAGLAALLPGRCAREGTVTLPLPGGPDDGR